MKVFRFIPSLLLLLTVFNVSASQAQTVDYFPEQDQNVTPATSWRFRICDHTLKPINFLVWTIDPAANPPGMKFDEIDGACALYDHAQNNFLCYPRPDYMSVI